MHPTARTATVIGAGFSGLLVAYRLLQKGYSVTVHEKSNRAGGLIQTLQTPYGLVETAAHSIRSAPAILQLCDELGVEIVRAQTKKKFILRRSKMKSMPLSLPEILRTLYHALQKRNGGATLAEWSKNHLGQAALDNLITPLAHGIYAAEPEELDQQLAFPNLTAPHDKSLLGYFLSKDKPKQKPFVFAPKDGLQGLNDALAKAINSHPQGNMIFESQITDLPEDENIIIATSAPAAGRILNNDSLTNLRYASMITATVFIDKNKLQDLQGIGFLYARSEHENILGILFNSVTFKHRAPENIVSLTVMLGGTSDPEILNKTDSQIQNIIVIELRHVLDLRGDILDCIITRWPQAIPVYSSELKNLIAELESGWCATPGHIIVGNYTGDVSIRGMTETVFAKTV